MIWRAMAVVLVAAISAQSAIWVSDRDPPVIMTKQPTTETPRVHVGGTFVASYEFFRHKSCYTSVSRFITDAANTRFVVPSLDFVQGALPVGHDKARVPVVIPQTATPGPATYRTVNCYYCNPFHNIMPVCAPPRDIQFEITR